MMGGHQESGRRAGTENVPYIVGLGRACELAHAVYERRAARGGASCGTCWRGAAEKAIDATVNGDTEHRLPNTTNISFKYIEGESILMLLSEVGIAASSGSACTSGSLEPSHVLRAMGIPFTRVHGSVRFSLSRYNIPRMCTTLFSTCCALKSACGTSHLSAGTKSCTLTAMSSDPLSQIITQILDSYATDRGINHMEGAICPRAGLWRRSSHHAQCAVSRLL